MRLQDLLVGELMSTAVVSIKEDDLVTRANVRMKFADVRHLPVVDAGAHVVGILSNRDVMTALAGHGRRRAVGDVMTRPVVTIRADEAASEAAARMLEHKIGSLPVVNEDRQLIGVITETDLLRVAHQALRYGPLWQHEWR
jgi:CBS domain-containing protein